MENFKVNPTSANPPSALLFLAFGFCEYENPEGTLRCIRLLNGWQIQDKKLVVSVLQCPFGTCFSCFLSFALEFS